MTAKRKSRYSVHDLMVESAKHVRELPPKQRTAFIRYFCDGQRHALIASELGTTPENSRRLVYRAKKRILKLMHGWTGPVPSTPGAILAANVPK
jgi:DNA-directed RNA polymerase specialized sigma24 family protein